MESGNCDESSGFSVDESGESAEDDVVVPSCGWSVELFWRVIENNGGGGICSTDFDKDGTFGTVPAYCDIALEPEDFVGCIDNFETEEEATGASFNPEERFVCSKKSRKSVRLLRKTCE